MVTEYCFVHEFEWEVVRDGKYDFRGFTMDIVWNPRSVQLFPWSPGSYGLKVVDVEYKADQLTWKAMGKICTASLAQARFKDSFTLIVKGHFPLKSRIDFRLVLEQLNQDYSFCLVDRLRGDQLWSAAANRQFTDVEFVVGGRLFPAHRAIAAARSPYFAKLFGSEHKVESAKCKIANCDPCTFEQLLFFVYTGGLQASADNRDLLQHAREYGIATLQSICEWAVVS